MSNQPSVAVRRWIKWADSLPSEPTSTLVLTSARSYFVDVRVLLHNDMLDVKDLPAASTEEAIKNCLARVDGSSLSRLDWAFAGTSSRVEQTQDQPCHGTWRHWVDSRHAEAEKVKDEGDLFPEYNDQEELELEIGSMPHTLTGKITDYEEVWASNPSLPVGEASDIERICVVLVTESYHKPTNGAKSEVRGMIIRLGRWMQGIIRQQGQILVERWVWTDSRDDEADHSSTLDAVGLPHGNGTWMRNVKIQHLVGHVDDYFEMPGQITMTSANELSEGQVIRRNNITWKVEEITRW